MTSNQIAYWTLQETKRSNQEKERETKRANLVSEGETMRSHAAQEQISISNLREVTRHNLATERQASIDFEERKRSNLAQESIAISNLAEASRHNIAQESINSVRNDIEFGKLSNEQARTQLTAQQLRETERANKVREQEEQRANLAREQELKRSNLAKETQAIKELAEIVRNNNMVNQIQTRREITATQRLTLDNWVARETANINRLKAALDASGNTVRSQELGVKLQQLKTEKKKLDEAIRNNVTENIIGSARAISELITSVGSIMD